MWATLGVALGYAVTMISFISKYKIIIEYAVKGWNFIKRVWNHPIFKSWIDKIFMNNDNLSENSPADPD